MGELVAEKDNAQANKKDEKEAVEFRPLLLDSHQTKHLHCICKYSSKI